MPISRTPSPPRGPVAPSHRPEPPRFEASIDDRAALAEPVWRWLLVGMAAAWPATFVLPVMFGWVLSALPHEMGHATIGCLLGHPSAPAISLSGDAWTGIGERRNWLVVAVALVAAIGAWTQRRQLPRCIALGVVAIALPLLAMSKASEVVIAAGGHLGELAFATFCFWQCVRGGYTGEPKERIGAALAGSLLQANHLRLCFGLMTSAAARAHYASNGSLGMKNDMLVIAEDLMHCRLQTVAAAMLVLGLLPLPLGALLGWLGNRREQA